MAYNNEYSSSFYRLELNTDVVFKLLGKTEKKNLELLNRFLKAYFGKKLQAGEYRFNSIQLHEETMKLECASYLKLKDIHERFTGTQLLAFEISEQVDKVMDWLLEKSHVYRIDTLFGKDLSIIFEDPANAMEFKLRFASE